MREAFSMQTRLSPPENEINLLKSVILEKEISVLKDKVKYFEDETSRLYEIIRQLKSQAFGPKKERWISTPGEQLPLFNEAEVEASQPEEKEESEETEVSGHKRKRGKRKPLPENLEREVVVIELKPEEQFSEEGSPLKVIGKEVSEKLVYSPATVKVIEYQRLVYGLESGDPVKTAPPVPSIIPKGIATPSLLAGIIVNKYADGLPLYRQESIFARHGIELSRTSMARWVVQTAEACRPLINILNDRLMDGPYISCDETHTQVLMEKGRTAESKSWMWVRATPGEKNKIVLFDYDPHRSSEVAKNLLSGYKGYLQVDGFASYNKLEKEEGLHRIGCNMHGRRKFHEAAKHGAKNGLTLAEQALKFYKTLYEIEADCREMEFDQRYNIRLERAVPIWKDFEKWAIEKQGKVPPKSKIGQAFHYFVNELPYLKGYLKDGQLEADNGFCERAIKNFAIGRNNWLFSFSEAGAEASSFLYSLIVTAKVNGANPYSVLERIFTELPMAEKLEDFDRLVDLLLNINPI